MAQAQVVAKAEPLTLKAVQVRRFQLPDLYQHGGWVAKRLVAAYPHKSEKELVGWLRGLIDLNEFLFLYQPHGVALAQVVRLTPLAPTLTVQEVFVLAEDGFQKQAVTFYDEFARWAKAKNIGTLIIGELSDVPPDLYKERLGGRLFNKTVTYARV